MRKKEREITEYSAIESVITDSDVCRIAFADGNMPYIVTMNFGYTGGKQKRFYFHCANEGRKLEMLAKNNFVCFELDTSHHVYSGSVACDWGTKYRSVVGYGYIRVSQNMEEKRTSLDKIMEHYGAKGPFEYNSKIFEKTTVLILEVTEMTGKEKD